MGDWSVAQVEGLAPDASSLRAARKLATAAKWTSPGRTVRALWGELQGSGKKPYRTRVDLNEPVFNCSCPSRKYPCKHGLALLLVLAEDPAAVLTGSPPDWVEEWLTGRDERAAKKAAPKPKKAPDPKAQERRRARREERIAAGLDELERWLLDVASTGVAQTVDFAASARALAARMVDAQAPGLEPRLQALAHKRGEELAEAIGRLWLLVSACRRIDTLPAPLAASVRTAIGLAQSKSDVLAGKRVKDRWYVVGYVWRQAGRVDERRTYLWGERTRRPALLLDFVPAGGTAEYSLLPGKAFEADLAFYAAGYEWRAVLPDPSSIRSIFRRLPDDLGDASLSAALDRHADALAGDPWLYETPLLLRNVRIHLDGTNWLLVDRTGEALVVGPLGGPDTDLCEMFAAASEGEFVHVAGTFDGRVARLRFLLTKRGQFFEDAQQTGLLVGWKT